MGRHAIHDTLQAKRDQNRISAQQARRRNKQAQDIMIDLLRKLLTNQNSFLTKDGVDLVKRTCIDVGRRCVLEGSVTRTTFASRILAVQEDACEEVSGDTNDSSLGEVLTSDDDALMNAAQTPASNEQTDPDYVPPLPEVVTYTNVSVSWQKQFDDEIDSDWTTLLTEQLPLPDKQLELQAEQLAPPAEQQIADGGF